MTRSSRPIRLQTERAQELERNAHPQSGAGLVLAPVPVPRQLGGSANPGATRWSAGSTRFSCNWQKARRCGRPESLWAKRLRHRGPTPDNFRNSVASRANRFNRAARFSGRSSTALEVGQTHPLRSTSPFRSSRPFLIEDRKSSRVAVSCHPYPALQVPDNARRSPF
jgi:hypothetical protein